MELSFDEKIESLEIGDYKIIQAASLYRFTSDAVLLSRFAKAKNNMTVADICSGSVIVGLHFFALNDQSVKNVFLYELQKPLADMSQKSVTLNKLDEIFTVKNQPIQQIEEQGAFDLVLCNPPYKKAGAGEPNENEHIALCRHELKLNLSDIAKAASKLLKHGGRFCMCHQTERLCEVICELEKCKLFPTRLCFVETKGEPYLFLIEAAKNTKPPFKIEKTIVNNAKSFSGEKERK